jgi:branched-chain amino acid transport system permease protein
MPDPVSKVPSSMRGTTIGWLLLALLALMPLVSSYWGGSYLTSLMMKAMILAIAVVSLNLLIGYGGLVSFGHAALVAVGAYAAAIALDEGMVDAVAILALSILASGAFALVTGALSLRTSGVYFIMITLAFAQMLFFVLSSLSQYGGDDGLTLWDTASLFGTDILQSDTGLFYVILVTLAGMWALVNAISVSRFGRVLRAAKENPTRVETMGYSVFRYRLIAYVIAGMIAGVAGFLLVHQAEFVSPAIGTWQRSGELIIMVVLGGMATRNGPLLGALFVVLVEEGLSEIVSDWRLIFGPMLILIVLFARGGLSSVFARSAKPGEAKS